MTQIMVLRDKCVRWKQSRIRLEKLPQPRIEELADLRLDLGRMLSRVSAPQRHVIHEVFVACRSYSDVAKEMGVSAQRAMQLAKLGTRQLREIFHPRHREFLARNNRMKVRTAVAAKLEELTAQFAGERMRWDETILGTVQLPIVAGAADAIFDPPAITIKGPADTDELQYGVSYRFYGKWETYKNQRTGQDERQFHFSTFVRVQPHNRGGVIRYLMASPGVGQKTAERLWEKLGPDAVRVLRKQPAAAVAAVDLSHFTLERAELAAEHLRDEQAMEGCTIDLLDVLHGRGLPKSVAKKAVKKWGNRAAELIRRNPYRLMAFRGVGFLKTDAMYLDLGLPPAKLKRQAYSAWYAVASDTEGHTWYPVSTIERGIRAKVSAAVACPPAALKLAKRGKLLATRRDERGALWVADYRKAMAEARLAGCVADALTGGGPVRVDVEYRTLERFPGYRIGSDGSIQSCWSNSGEFGDTWRSLSAETIKGGYQRVRLRVETQRYVHAQVSHLVLEAFWGPRPFDYVACHWDGNPTNNTVGNLRWDSRSDNEEDKKRHGTHQTGEGNPAAKLTEKDVLEIRAIYESGEKTTYELGDQFGVSRPVVCKIVKGELWSHI